MTVYEFLKIIKDLYDNLDFEINDDGSSTYNGENIFSKSDEKIIIMLIDKDNDKLIIIIIDNDKIDISNISSFYFETLNLKNLDIKTIGDDSTKDMLSYGRILNDNLDDHIEISTANEIISSLRNFK